VLLLLLLLPLLSSWLLVVRVRWTDGNDSLSSRGFVGVEGTSSMNEETAERRSNAKRDAESRSPLGGPEGIFWWPVVLIVRGTL
jgi:hypothetical protein